MVAKVKDWFVRNKFEIVLGSLVLSIMVSLLSIVFNVMLMAISEDLTNVVQTKNNEIEELTYERNYYYGMCDSIQRTYEEVVPKQQYIQDVEYLESVILELRTQCEAECKKYETYNR